MEFSGKFAACPGQPSKGWRIEVGRVGRNTAAVSNSQLLTAALADLQRLERREKRRHAAHYLFNGVLTHRIRILTVLGGKRTWLIDLRCQLRGDVVDVSSGATFSPDQQAQRIARFCASLFDDDDGKPRQRSWRYALPGYDAQLFWASAVLSRYCAFWGIR